MSGLARRGLRAEWTKLRSVRSTAWTVMAIVAVTVGVTAFLAAVGGTDANQAGGLPGDDDVVVNSLRGVWTGQIPMVALGVIAMTSEFATGTIRTTFTALPRRRKTLAAKAATVGLVALAVGSAASLLSFLIAQPLLHAGGYVGPAYPVVSLTDATVIRAVAGTAVYLTLLALFALGVAAIVRHTATAMTLVVALVLVPNVIMETFPRQRIRELLEQFFPAGGLSIQVTSDLYHTPPLGTWGGLGVTAAWTLAAVLGAAWAIGRRDV
jgi:ABC-type transport system involved in multi-copper enzyme maturation permease subunit